MLLSINKKMTFINMVLATTQLMRMGFLTACVTNWIYIIELQVGRAFMLKFYIMKQMGD